MGEGEEPPGLESNLRFRGGQFWTENHWAGTEPGGWEGGISDASNERHKKRDVHLFRWLSKLPEVLCSRPRGKVCSEPPSVTADELPSSELEVGFQPNPPPGPETRLGFCRCQN